VNVDTGEFRALTAEVTRLTEAVRHMTMTMVALEIGREDGQEAARNARPGRAPGASRPQHLQVVDGGQP